MRYVTQEYNLIDSRYLLIVNFELHVFVDVYQTIHCTSGKCRLYMQIQPNRQNSLLALKKTQTQNTKL